MTAPFIYITTHRIDPERSSELTELLAEYTDFVQANEKDLLAHHSYLDAGGTELTLVQIHRDAPSAEEHMRLAGPLIHRGLGMTQTVRAQVFGDPGLAVGQALLANAEAGAELIVAPTPGPGFVREGARDD